MGNHRGVVAVLHLTYRAPIDRSCLAGKGHRVQLGVSDGPVLGLDAGCPSAVFHVVEQPGGVSEAFAVLDYEELVGHQVREYVREAGSEDKHVSAVYLDPCGEVRDLALLPVLGVPEGLGQDNYG